MANYPGSLPSLGTKTDNVDNVAAADYNNLAGEITAVATELGTDVAGDQTDLKTRLANSLSDSGYLEFAQEALLTIASGEITVTQNLHRIETEGGAASDELDTINGEANGAFVILRASADNHTVVIKDGTGNIETAGGADITLDTNTEFAFGYYDGTLSKWILSKGASGGVVTGEGTSSYLTYWSDSETLDTSIVYQWNSGGIGGIEIGDATANVDYQYGVNGEDNDGYFTWMEDEDYWSFDDGIMIPAGEQIYFRDTAISIASGDDGHLDIAADTSVDLNTPLINLADPANIALGTSTGTKIGTATNQKLGFFNATPVTQQTELTDELTTITFTAPGTPDYAIQDLIDSGAGSAFGFATKDEGNSVLAVIANLQARVNELETKLVALGLLADAD